MSNCVVVFPGQGTQRPGMARDFHATFPTAAAVFEEVSEELGFDVGQLCFRDDPRLNLTEFAQPTILTVEIAMLRALQAEFGLRPTYFGGHSLGEYTALVAAGVLPLAQAARLVRERGRLMQEATPPGYGAMAAVLHRQIDLEAIAGCLRDLTVDIANLNAPGQIVLSGVATDLEQAIERVRGHPGFQGAQCKVLRVSTPFHSRLLLPLEPHIHALLDAASAGWDVAGAACVVSNFSGTFHTAERGALVHALTRQVSGRVRWVDNMRALMGCVPDRIIEIGPASPLRGFFQLLQVWVTSITSVSTARRALAP